MSGTDVIDRSRLSNTPMVLDPGGALSSGAPIVSVVKVANHTRVSANPDGDGQADFRIMVANAPGLVAGDFVL